MQCNKTAPQDIARSKNKWSAWRSSIPYIQYTNASEVLPGELDFVDQRPDVFPVQCTELSAGPSIPHCTTTLTISWDLSISRFDDKRERTNHILLEIIRNAGYSKWERESDIIDMTPHTFLTGHHTHSRIQPTILEDLWVRTEVTRFSTSSVVCGDGCRLFQRRHVLGLCILYTNIIVKWDFD